MSTIWNLHTETITTSRLVVTDQGLANYRKEFGNCYLGYFDNELRGFVNFDDEDDHIYVNQIAIDPDYTGKGIGSELIREIIDIVRKEGKSSIKLAVQVSNVNAINFFIKHGFVILDLVIETKYVPSNMVLADLSMIIEEDQKEFLRLVEYQMKLHISKHSV